MEKSILSLLFSLHHDDFILPEDQLSCQGPQGGVGGKLHVFLSCLPKVGSNALAVRDLGSRTSDKEPMKNMMPASTEYRRMAESAAESMVRLAWSIV